MKVDLSVIREEILEEFESRRDKDGPSGCFRWLPNSRTNLYASLDVAIAYPIMGVKAGSLDSELKNSWINHINSYADDYAKDGRYKDIIPRHSPFHCNGMVIGALGYLGGKQVFPIKLYEAFDTPVKIKNWLENIDWPNQWASGFWGGPMMFSMSKTCTDEWINTVIAWLNNNLDDETGMWRKGVSPSNIYQPLGGFVHIYPIYEFHRKHFSHPDKVIDCVYKLQTSDGNWYPNNAFSYLDMDALYAYAAMLKQSDKKKDLVYESTLKYAGFLMGLLNKNKKEIYQTITMHGLLCLASTFGLLNQLLPETFTDSAKWLDIFSARMLYRTNSVEV